MSDLYHRHKEKYKIYLQYRLLDKNKEFCFQLTKKECFSRVIKVCILDYRTCVSYFLYSSRSEEGRRPSRRSEVYKFVAWGSREDCLGRSNLDLPIYISMVSAQLPSNKTKSRPLTVAHSHVSSACFFISCLHLCADILIHRL